MIILMADIKGSSTYQAGRLMTAFRKTVAAMNGAAGKAVLSPLTITLGDEFQGVVKSPAAALGIIFHAERLVRKQGQPFQMRFVMYEGGIDTKINHKKAYEMLGPGLAAARAALTAMKSSRHRFLVRLDNESLTERLSLALNVYQGIVDRWTDAQLKVASTFDQKSDYREVAKVVKRDPTVIWRRKRSLMIDEYNDIMKLAQLTAQEWKAV